ncbi:MAG: gliding motility-associated C-terminal domain-containing protein [Bacteroidetes bacterium]|nr:gliding motility-associated C-terminal domain-containing protein [Bacteroidota bacterium]
MPQKNSTWKEAAANEKTEIQTVKQILLFAIALCAVFLSPSLWEGGGGLFSQVYINDNFSTGLQGWAFVQSGCTNESNLVWQGTTDAATGGNAPPSANIFKTCTSCCGAGNCWYNGACKTNGTGNCTPPSGAICSNAIGSPCSYYLFKTVTFSPMAYQFTLTFKWRAGSNLNSSTVTNAQLTVINNDNSTNIASTNLVSGGTYDTGWLIYTNTFSVCGGVNSVTVRIGGWDSWTQTPWCHNIWLDDANLTVTQTGTGMPVATAGPNVSICPAQSTTLSSSGGTGYIWSPSSGLSNPNISNPVATPTATTTYTVTVSNVCGSSTASTSVTLYPNPSPSISGGTTLCSGQSTTLTASGGNSYSWIPSGQTTTNIVVSPTTNTTYTVIATSVNGCTASATSAINVSSLPNPIISGNTTLCSGQSSTLTASGGNSYSWLPSGQNATSIVVNPTTNTTYTVIAANANGCTNTAAVTTTVNSLPTPSITGNTNLCNGQSATLTASGGNSYSWIPVGQTTSSIIVTPTANTTYTVIATNVNGCTNSATVAVTVGAITATISGNSIICLGQNATLTASGGINYSWNTGATTTSITAAATATATYSVIATNASGCTGTATFVVNVNPLPNVSITGANTICSGASETLTASGGINYSWNTGATSSSIIISPTSTTNYSVTVTDVNGCSASAAATATVFPSPAIIISGINLICNGSAVTLTASGGNNYSWSNGATTSSIIVTTAGTYSVIGTNANGCTGISTQTVSPTSAPVANIFGNSPLCAGQTISLTASGGNSYSWNTGQTTSSITATATATTTYSVIVSNGICADDTSITVIVNPNPSGNIIPPSDTINLGGSATLTASGGTNYSWSNGSTASIITVSPTVTTTYTVFICDANGCCDVVPVTVYVEINCGELFVPNAFSPNGDTKNDVLYVRNSCIKEMEFIIYNRWGQEVFRSTNPANGWDGNVNGKPAQTAVFAYYLHAVFLSGKDETKQGTVTLLR